MQSQEITSTDSDPNAPLSQASSSSSSIDPSAGMPQGNPRSRFTDSPNARSKTMTTADGAETHGVLNRHAANPTSYQVGVSEDIGNRRTMEDAHSFVTDFAGVRGQGFFAVFDGHAGKHAAEWCGNSFHEYLLEALRALPDAPIPDVLNQAFHNVDLLLSKMCEESEGKIHSGCTAVTAFLRIEDPDGGRQSFLKEIPEVSRMDSPESDAGSHRSGSASPTNGEDEKQRRKKGSASRLKNALRSLGGSVGGRASPSASSPSTPRSMSPGPAAERPVANAIPAVSPPAGTRRVLYTANAGDARAVLCRAGKAVRLTYDHKGSDKQEAKRITDAGGFVLSGRVNGVLAVTRSLGDSSMKDFVVGSPYTTETELCDEDEFMILACDGLWDVSADQVSVDLIKDIDDAQAASDKLLKHALSQHTTDNVTVVVVKFKKFNPAGTGVTVTATGTSTSTSASSADGTAMTS